MSLTQEILASTETSSRASIPAQLPDSQTTHLDLAGGQRLLIEHGAQKDVLTLIAQTGEIALTIHVTPSGPILRFESGLKIEATGPLELAGKSVAIRGAEGVSVESGGDANIDIAGDLSTTARIQHIKARLGNVNVKANDDVRLKGERIRLNC